MVKFHYHMKTLTTTYSRPKQGVLPMFISDSLDICDPVLTFDEFMEGIDLAKYLDNYRFIRLEDSDIIPSTCSKLCFLDS